jgi:hypothetical protein
MKFETTEIINAGLMAIRNNPKYESFSQDCFLFPKTIETNSILFIGINPSSSENQKPYDSYELCQIDNKHPYFKRMEEIAKDCQISWTHLDLLFFRETNQDSIYDILNKDNGVAYIWEQLQISDKLIKAASPKVIVVCNVLAGIFLGKEQDRAKNKNIWLGYDFIFDEILGTYIWNKTPIFFSGMLTGQRALDNGSYERLKWHIKKTIKDLSEKN